MFTLASSKGKVKEIFKNSPWLLTTKVVVKAVEQEALTMSASVTGVKTIVAQFNKDIASPAAVKVTVTKGTSARDCKATVDGSKITIAMDTKLVAGTYTVSVEGVDTAAMTADVVVEKDETLTSFEISPNLVMKNASATNSAICYYQALNQYGEPMNADQPNVSSSFGSGTKIGRTATSSVKGIIAVDDITSVLAVKGTKGTIVLVDKSTGVTTSKEVTVSDAATASEVTVAGTYNTSSAKIESISAGATLSNYYILLSVKDQYGDGVDADSFANVANISVAGGLTNVALADSVVSKAAVDVTVDGTSYVGLKLASAKAVAGSYTLTVVNTTKGLLHSGTYTIGESTVVKSISISAKDSIYNNQDNEMEYTITDAEGNAITSYSTLKDLLQLGNGSGLSLSKNADGTAKMIYHPQLTNFSTSDTATTFDTVIVGANGSTSTNYMVKTFNFTVNKDRKIKAANSIASDATVSAAVGAQFSVGFDKIVYVDQYSLKVTSSDSFYNRIVSEGALGANVSGCSVCVVTKGGMTAQVDTTNKKFAFNSTAAGSATVYLKYGTDVTATSSSYDCKFTVNAVSTTGVDASTLKIASVNSGYAVKDDTTLTTSMISVTGTVGGVTTAIPTSQYVITGIKNNSFTTAEENAGTNTKTATVSVQVTTWDGNGNNIETVLTADYTVSTSNSYVYKFIGTDASKLTTATSGTALKADDFQKCFTFEDQYNTNSSAGVAVDTILGTGKVATNVTYDVNVKNATTAAYKVTSANTNSMTLEFKSAGTYTVDLTATLNGTSKTVTLTIVVS